MNIELRNICDCDHTQRKLLIECTLAAIHITHFTVYLVNHLLNNLDLGEFQTKPLKVDPWNLYRTVLLEFGLIPSLNHLLTSVDMSQL